MKHRELFEEMPAAVKITTASLLESMRGRSFWSQQYPKHIAEYIMGMGFFDGNLGPAVHHDRRNPEVYLSARFILNDVSRAALQDMTWVLAQAMEAVRQQAA